jgi:outer membrane protein TolC
MAENSGATRHRRLVRAAFLVLCVSRAGSVAAQDSTVVSPVEAVRRALATHPSVGVSQAELEGSEALAAEARSARLPRLALDVGGTRYQEPMIVAPLHGFDPRRPPRFDETVFLGRLQAGWTVFDGGARQARIERARANAGAAAANAEAARSALIERTVRAYLRVRGAREVQAAHAAQVISLEAERDRATRMYAAGRVARVTVLRAEAALSRAEAARSTAGAALREAEAELARLAGVEAGEVALWSVAAAAAGPLLERPDRSESVEAAVASSPAVARARWRQEAASAGRQEVGAGFWPTLSLLAGYNAFAGAKESTITEWQAALQLAWPVFTGGARRAAVDRTAAELTGAAAAVRLAELEVAADVDRALTGLEEAQARALSLEAAARQFEEVAQVESLALETGAGVQSDYLRAVSDLAETRAALTEARSAVVGSHVTVARVTGKLTIDWLERMVEVRR